jgi:DMSO reductase anchor subunit
LVGALGASITSTFVPRPGAFISTGIVAVLLSSLHLGRRGRAHRAILNWRSSWVSREVLFFILFLSFGSLYLAIAPLNGVVGWVALTAGFATLFAMDRVYGVTGARGSILHSGGVIITGIFAWGVLSGHIVLAVTLALVKMSLYSLRRFRSVGRGGPTRTLSSVFRVAVGLFVPLVVWLFGSRDLLVYAGVGAFSGELVDRCEYYLDLDIPSPRREMAIELARHIRNRP